MDWTHEDIAALSVGLLLFGDFDIQAISLLLQHRPVRDERRLGLRSGRKEPGST
jgi:hypothetical protein